MQRVIQIKYGADNLGYLIHDRAKAIAIDPGAPGFILDYIQKESLHLKEIRNTHSHFDHTSGNQELSASTGAPVVVSTGPGRFYLGDETIEIIPTPGHTRDSVCFLSNGWVITGDTLFIANVGNCLPGLIRPFRKSLDRLLELPDDTTVYPGHDYTGRSIRRALEIEPENPDIINFLESYNPPPVASTIGEEKKINPYLRTDEPTVIAYLTKNEKDVSSSLHRFQSFLEC